MSLKYFYNKFNTPSVNQICNIFNKYEIIPLYPVLDNFKDVIGKQSASKNVFGYVLMHLSKEQILELLPGYLVDLECFNIPDSNKLKRYNRVFNHRDKLIISTLHLCVEAIQSKNLNSLMIAREFIKANCATNIDSSDIFEVFSFGLGKYSEWSFLKINPYLLVPAIARHMYKFYYVSKEDEETNINHMAHAYCNLIMLEHIIRNQRKK